ncbi:MAG TPA: c-type cytochrome [Thermoanaerobaculia bacterium]
MRALFPKLMAGGLLLAGLALPALSTPQQGQARPNSATATTPTPDPMPSHPAGQSYTPPDAQQAPRPNSMRDFIKGHENEPAEKVFKNIQLLKGVPAGRFLDAMDGFANALGTKCRECHDTENFASDDKDEKKVARGMIQMTKGINEQYIKTMPGLDRDAAVSCYTCHHGKTHPAGRPEGNGEGKEHQERH